ncbi:MAG TPA: hypothetical protein VFX76_00360, partial [Roseiflexaceae bacterium]|nr:hypothetical protein [Roseiflexaceae bacterium]
MKSAHLQNVEMEASAVQVDKLTHIRGIGPAFERYLNQVGIFTYAQLATYSPTDLAELLHGYAGISAQQVAKQDWIGHARALATRSLQSTHKEEERLIEPPSEGQAAPEAPAEAMETVLRQRSAIFTVQLELRPDGSVRR